MADLKANHDGLARQTNMNSAKNEHLHLSSMWSRSMFQHLGNDIDLERVEESDGFLNFWPVE